MTKNKRLENKEKRITFEQIMAGALLKFEKIDNVDISLLLEDFMSLDAVKVEPYFNIKNLKEYMNYYHKDGSISLLDKFPLDYFIEEEERTVKDKYIEVAGNIVNNYFNRFSVEEFKKRKEKLLKEQKESILKDANILLISDEEEDYNELINYGFQNIDYFKSIIRADKYFSKHPKQLEKYHIILKGNQYVQRCCFEGDVKLDNTLWDLRNNRKVLFTPLKRYKYSNHSEYTAYLSDFKSTREWDTEEDSYSKVLDRIIENSLINHIFKIDNLKDKKSVPIEDYVNSNRLTLPTKKSDLKILYLDSININESAKEIAQKLGLNITFKEDNNYSLGRYIKSHLGDYDIIIASSSYSSSILRMNNESTEQCKDTGRQLTLLVTYKNQSIPKSDEDGIFVSDGIGDKIELQYVFGGNLSNSQDIVNKEFRVLRKPYEPLKFESWKQHWEKYVRSQEIDMKSIIEEAVHLYNEKLLENNCQPLRDFDLTTAKTYDEEYDKIDKKEAERQYQALEPIHTFDSLRSKIITYLRYKNQGLISDNLDGLKITETSDGICVENNYQGRTLCTIIISKQYKQDNLRVFTIQTINKKGQLGNPEIVGIYTRKYENLEGTPNRPNELQMNAIIATKKKVDALIVPQNIKPLNNSDNKVKQKSRIFGKKKK